MTNKRRKNRSLLSKRKGSKDGAFTLRGKRKAIDAVMEVDASNPENQDNEEDKVDKNGECTAVASRLRSSTAAPTTKATKRDVQFRLRNAIFFVYVDVLDAPEATAWKGPNGTIRKIMVFLELREGQRGTVGRVL